MLVLYMEQEYLKLLNHIYPEIIYSIDRCATPAWKLDNPKSKQNQMLVYDGEATFISGSAEHHAVRGDLIYYKPGDYRIAYTSKVNLMKSYAIDFFYTCPVYEDDRWEMTVPALPFSFHQHIEDQLLLSRLLDLFSRITKSALSAKERNSIYERSLFTEILSLLFQLFNGTQYNYSNVRKIESVINYKAENYTQDLSLKELADYARISPSYFGNIFKKVTGKSAIDYLIEMRINKAKTLLLDGFTVSETSRRTGFNDIFYFSRAFKRHEGISPRQYVQTQQAENLAADYRRGDG